MPVLSSECCCLNQFHIIILQMHHCSIVTNTVS
uniref:Uncharacterized protein n=1 Tax=Anguilla anguilla TaxID=7936 RepID=A0A0E9UXH6_ANGAN